MRAGDMDWSKDRIVIARPHLPLLVKQPQPQHQTAPSLRMQRLGAITPTLSHRLVRLGPKTPQPALSTVDRAVIAAGIAMAVASASFAIFMVATDHPHPDFNGVENLMLFARPSHGVDDPVMARVGGGRSGGEDAGGIDYTTTGSIPNADKSPAGPNYRLPAINPVPEETVEGLTLRGVSGNVAVVEGPEGVYRLEVGSLVPGGGRVMGIEWRQGTFVVVTTRGLIREVQP